MVNRAKHLREFNFQKVAKRGSELTVILHHTYSPDSCSVYGNRLTQYLCGGFFKVGYPFRKQQKLGEVFNDVSLTPRGTSIGTVFKEPVARHTTEPPSTPSFS